MKRVVTTELLDNDEGTPAEIAASLGDLLSINRRFGGIATTEAMITRIAQEANAKSLSILEVAAGAGDLPKIVRQRLQKRGIQVEITLLDRAASHLNDGHGRNGNAIRAVVGDALALPFSDGAFDLVSCNLFAHHLSGEQVIQFANEGLRVSRIALLINDLIREWMHLAVTYAGMPLFHSRITRHDAPASVRQAYTVEEMRELLQRTTSARIDIDRHFLYRMAAIAWKK